MSLVDTAQAAVDALTGAFGDAQQALFEAVVQPLLFHAGLGSFISDAFDATGWLLVGVLQIAAMLLLIAPLQRWRPDEPRATSAVAQTERRQAVRVDVLYTLIHRLGLFRVALFFAVDPLFNALFGWLAVHGVDGWHLDQWIAPWWPGVSDTQLAGFLVYLLVFDLLNYALHRAQHQFNWWWALHALHHSQRHVTMWSDSRNHLLDSLIVDAVFVLVARVIGVAPGQFVALIALSQLVENLAHANLRLSFGWLGERLLVGPAFHRRHHGAGIGHESHGKGTLGGCNFAVLFPLWDMLLGTADFRHDNGPCGIRDQWPDEGGRDYGRGFWAQQRLGLLRLIGRA
ncbi:sterol desaturase family protein [Ideonella sp. 4Y16]|uniref:Sterol desaturase family protein n=1 Tax=Ideonella alba TaxID=2824118 RepID=A0A941BHS6_9BURK|nr:sterol desaturase family protein [Ideonella alba]MBQ0933467.1 sterol desaturase family protein [Ideonella alba]MBQ0945918.1 sterol desaturase family protein [Ideonella alba]